MTRPTIKIKKRKHIHQAIPILTVIGTLAAFTALAAYSLDYERMHKPVLSIHHAGAGHGYSDGERFALDFAIDNLHTRAETKANWIKIEKRLAKEKHVRRPNIYDLKTQQAALRGLYEQ